MVDKLDDVDDDNDESDDECVGWRCLLDDTADAAAADVTTPETVWGAPITPVVDDELDDVVTGRIEMGMAGRWRLLRVVPLLERERERD